MNVMLRLKLKTRLTLVIATLAIGFTVFGAWAFITLDQLKVNGPIYLRIVQGKDLIADILPPPEYIIESYLVSLQMTTARDQAEISALIDRLAKLRQEYDGRHEFWLGQSLEPELADVLLKQAHEPARLFFRLAEDEFLPAIKSGDQERALTILARMRQAYDQHRAAIDQVVSIAIERNKNDEQSAASSIRVATRGMGIVFILALGIALSLMMLTSRSLMQQLGGEPGEAETVARRITAGDLSGQSVPASQGLLGILGEMRDKLRSMIDQISHHSTRLASAAEALSAVTTQSSESVRELQSQSDQVVTAVEEMTATSEEVANNAATVANAARLASEHSQSGQSVVQSARNKVSELARQVESAADVINMLDQESAKIGMVVDVITEIADQTNLLALNAAIEAARAGEQGRGFAVVADEVRNLASRTQQSTKEILQMIQQLKSGVSSAVTAMSMGRSHAKDSLEQMVLADASLTRITEAIGNISNMTDHIATAMEQQSATTREIANNMSSISQATEQTTAGTDQTSAGTDQTSAASQELAQLASDLSGLTQRFRVTA